MREATGPRDGADASSRGTNETPLRRPYERLGVAWEEAFDVRGALAYACGKNDPLVDPRCNTAPGPS